MTKPVRKLMGILAAMIGAVGLHAEDAPPAPETLADGDSRTPAPGAYSFAAATSALRLLDINFVSGSSQPGMRSAFLDANVSGDLTAYVFSSPAGIPLPDGSEVPGGLVFVYELRNTTLSLDSLSQITGLSTEGWGGVQTKVAYGTALFDPTNPGSLVFPPSPVPPGATERSDDGLTDSITINFQAPPIFAGQNGMQLILFTDATDYVSQVAYVHTDSGEPEGAFSFEVTSLRGIKESDPTSVPDSGSTLVALALGIAALGGQRARMRK